MTKCKLKIIGLDDEIYEDSSLVDDGEGEYSCFRGSN